MSHLTILTGGPGSGKTTTIELLRDRDFICAAEVGRKIIKKQVRKQGKALPWHDKTAFRDEMLKEEIEAYKHYECFDVPVFFDRAVIDIYGYSKFEGLAITDELAAYCDSFRYNKNVFIFPPWEEIYTGDNERNQSFTEAVNTHQEMVNAYRKFGYTLIDVPKTNEIDRIEFILWSMGNA